jgi:hypothetical protein
MKLNKLVTIVILIRFALSVLWFAVECGQRAIVMVSLMSDNCSFLLVVHNKVCVFLFMYNDLRALEVTNR